MRLFQGLISAKLSARSASPRFDPSPAFPIDRAAPKVELPSMPSKQDLLDLQFIETRHKLIELAAFLDRIDRHPGAGDYRLDALNAALPILLESRPDRAKAILEALSDQTSEPIPQATFQGAFGAPQP